MHSHSANTTVCFELFTDEAKHPTKATSFSAGFDLYTTNDKTIIRPNEIRKFHTGIKVLMPSNFVGLIYARSGLGCTYGIVPSNCVGVIDSDYRGELLIALHNHSNIEYEVNKYDRIAQIVFLELPKFDVNYYQTSSLYNAELSKELIDNNTRGENGFGSSGK